MNILISSDWHLSPEGDIPPELDKFHDYTFLKLDQGWKVVLSGDIFIALECGWPAFLCSKAARVVGRMIVRGAILLEGNHDRNCPYFPQRKQIVLDGNYISHWDQFDLLWSWLPISRFPVPDCIRKWYRTPGKSKRQGKLQDWHISTATCEYRATLFAAKHSYKAVIGGHTHSGVVIDREGLIVANCGDFVDSFSWLEYEEGKLTLQRSTGGS